MVSIKWCLNQKNGLELIKPNTNMPESYLKMAEESINELSNIKSNIWTATASYYIFYYSLYALMLRIGIKCEIHSCSLEFMGKFLMNFYGAIDLDMINKAFSARIDLQYYADRPVDKIPIRLARAYCKTFFIKTKEILSKITEEQIQDIRNKLAEFR